MSTSMLVTALGAALLDFLWQGLLIGLASTVVLALMGNARPQARYLVACIALALCLALPLLSFVRSVATSTVQADANAAAIRVDVPPDRAIATLDTSAPAPIPALSQWQHWRAALQPQLPLLVTLWSLVASLLAARMAFGLAWVAGAGGVRGRAHPFWQARLDALAERMALPRRVLLRVVDDLDSPAAARVWRPVVLLPAALLTRMPADQLEALLAHELAHIRRHDYLVNLLQSLVEALLFYHPVVWWLSRRIRSEREQIADDLAVQAIGDPRRLARALAELAQCHPAPTPTLALAAAGGTLMTRIQRLLRPRRQALDWKFVLPMLGLSVVCVAALAQPQPAAPNGIVSDIASEDRHEPGDRYVVDGRPATRAEAERAAAEAERAGAMAHREAALAGALANAEAERAGALANADAVRAGALANAEAQRAGALANAEAERAGALAQADAQRSAAGAARGDDHDGFRTQGSLHIGGRAGRDGDYALVGTDRDRTMQVSATLDDLRNLDPLRDRVDGDFLWARRDGRAYVITDPALVARVRTAWAPTEPLSREMEVLGDEMAKHGDVMAGIGARMEAQAGTGEADAEAMEALGEQMSALGAQHAELAARMARAAHDEIRADDDTQRAAAERARLAVEAELETLEGRMEALTEQMEAHSEAMERAHAPLEALGDEMERAGEPMEALGEQMEVLGEKMEALSEAADATTRALIEQAAREGKLVPVESIATR